MKRLTANAAAIMREEIQAKRLVYNIDAHMAMHGSCNYFRPRPAAEPTSAIPGSPEKIAVLRMRVELGQELWHPMDDKTPPEPTCKEPVYVAGIRVIVVE